MRPLEVSPLVQRFDAHLSHIINKIFDKAASLDADTDFADASPGPRRSVRTRKPNNSYKKYVETPSFEKEDDSLAIEAESESDVGSESDVDDHQERGEDGLLDDVAEEELILSRLTIDQFEGLDRSKRKLDFL